MTFKYSLLLLVIFAGIICSENNQIKITKATNESKLLPIATGSGLLAVEFIGIPLINMAISYKKIPHLKNPLKYIYEKEHYMEDKLWHFVGASIFTEMNYYLYEKLYFIDEPYIVSGLTSLAFWTGIECMDGMAGSGFSLRDETANILGITFEILRLRYPNLPLRVRIGAKNWNEFSNAASRVFSGAIHHELGTQYDYMKVEFVYLFPTENLYAGIAISRKNQKDDQAGISAGFDLISWLNNKKKGWWNYPLKSFDTHFSLNLELTYWLN